MIIMGTEKCQSKSKQKYEKSPSSFSDRWFCMSFGKRRRGFPIFYSPWRPWPMTESRRGRPPRLAPGLLLLMTLILAVVWFA